MGPGDAEIITACLESSFSPVPVPRQVWDVNRARPGPISEPSLFQTGSRPVLRIAAEAVIAENPILERAIRRRGLTLLSGSRLVDA